MNEDKVLTLVIVVAIGYVVYTQFFKKSTETPPPQTEEVKDYKMTMKDLESAIDAQVNSGIGQRYHNINEAARALDNEQRIKQDSRQYQTVRCSSCDGKGEYYDRRDGKYYTCPQCNGHGVVVRYN